ncbi:MAG TPA: DUF2252 family protein [Pedococcus sp.]|nr:DUF2252 family protein [Pedococcus sp.]
MQSASDIFLGWSEGVQTDQYHYRRQLRDMKCSAVVENMIAARLNYSAKICAWTLARGHARPGDALRSPATSGPRGGRRQGDLRGSRSSTPNRTTATTPASREAISSGRIEAREACDRAGSSCGLRRAPEIHLIRCPAYRGSSRSARPTTSRTASCASGREDVDDPG